MEFTQIITDNNLPVSKTYANFYQLIESSSNKNLLESILNKRAVHGVPVISSFNSNGLTCDFSSGLTPDEKKCIDEFLSIYFGQNHLSNETTYKIVDPIVESISNNFNKFSDMFSLESYDPIDFVFELEQINTKHYNFFKCLQFALILSKLDSIETAFKEAYGPDMTLSTGELNGKSVSSFMDLYNFMMDKVRQKFYKLMETAPSPLWSRMQLNSHKQIWALMWNVYSREFAYLHEIESKYKIHEEKMEELFKKLCGYYTETDDSGKQIEKFTNQDNMEKFSKFTEICDSAKKLFHEIIDNVYSNVKLTRNDYDTIASNVSDKIISELDEYHANYAKKYIPIMLELEISMNTLLDTTTNVLDVVITQLEKELQTN